MSQLNHPYVVWASCFLWLASMFAITWSLLLFFCVDDILLITGNDLVNALVLLLGIVMLPTNVHMLYTIAQGRKIDPKAKVICCPLWICILWIIIISFVGIILCFQRIHHCEQTAKDSLSHSMKNYRSVPKYKHFIDNLQWSLKCCGLNSYKDWFKQDWYDNIRDYEWSPANIQKRDTNMLNSVADSVPLSCCKSGACVSNFLMELGTHSIHTKGCGKTMYSLIMISMNVHLIVFALIIIIQVLLLKYISSEDGEESLVNKKTTDANRNVRHLMPVNKNFELSSGSSSCSPDDESDLEAARKYEADEKVDDGNY